MDVVERSVRSWIASGKDAEVEKLVVGMYLTDLSRYEIMIVKFFRHFVGQRHFPRYCQGPRRVSDVGRG
jgi:hypothetical protein